MGRRDRTIFLTITVAVVLALHIYLSDDQFPADAPIDTRRSLRLNDPKALTHEITSAPWTEEEHGLFLRAVEKYGPSRWAWRHIAGKQLAGKRSTDEVQEHWREMVAHRDDPDYLPYAPSSPELQTELADEGPIDASDGAAVNTGQWTEEEHELFLQGKAHFGTPGKKTWNRVAHEFIPTRSGEEVRDHWREYAANRDDPNYLPYAPSSPELQTELADEGPIDASDGAVMNKHPWTEAEHGLFLQVVEKYGPSRWTWRNIADKQLAGKRSTDQVQAHWREYVTNRDDPDYLPYAPSSPELQTELADEGRIDASDGAVMNNDPWTEEEHGLFLQVVETYGPSRWAWRNIADKQLAGKRSADQVQAHWREYAANRDDSDYLPYAPSSPELQTELELADEGPIDASDGTAMNPGPWTKDEHDLFLQGKAHFGTPGKKTWNRVARDFIPTRSGEEVRDHWREYAANRDDPSYLPYAPSSPELQTELEMADKGPIDVSDRAARNTGPWTAEEHDLFLQGLGMWGISRQSWRKIAKGLVKTRHFKQVEEHAWEYFTANARGERAPTEFFGWPDRDYVAAGTYFHGGRQWRGEKLSFLQMSKPNPDYGRVLLYISSHFSKQHEMYLRYCWKNVLARSPLLQEADIAVHLNPNKASARKPAMDLLKDVFGDHNLMVYVRNYEGMFMTGVEGPLNTGSVSQGAGVKQAGAVMAMYEAAKHKYFDGYDWVIRLNPDVLIRDDTYFRQAMINPDLAALLVDCYAQRPNRGLHLNTDFFAVRPEVLLEEAFPREIVRDSAETTFTASMVNTVIKSGPRHYEFVPGADPTRTFGCRVGGGKDFFDSPVVHEHALHPDICAVPEDEMPAVEEAFPDGWPERWKSID